MQQLLRSDCEKLLTLAGELYSVEQSERLPEHLLKLLHSVIEYDLGGCHLIHPSTRRISACYVPDRAPLPAQHREFWRLTAAHPLSSLLFTTSAKAWKISDVMSRRAFHQTELYEVLYRPLRVDCELAGTLPDPTTPGVFLLVALHRSSHDFSERDRSMLNLLLPHLGKARERLHAISRWAPNGHWWFCDEETFYEWLCQHTPWGLSRRESEVLFWLCQGKTNAEIGSILGIAGRTAETHALNIYPKMGVENRYTAIATLTQLAATSRHSFACRS
jgi:DNA-binding CsgD family transcriptional regulator